VKIAVSREEKNTGWKCFKKCWGSIDIYTCIYIYINNILYIVSTLICFDASASFR